MSKVGCYLVYICRDNPAFFVTEFLCFFSLVVCRSATAGRQHVTSEFRRFSIQHITMSSVWSLFVKVLKTFYHSQTLLSCISLSL